MDIIKYNGDWGNVKYNFQVFRNKNFKKGNFLISTTFFLLKKFSKGILQIKPEFEKNKHFKEKIKRYTTGLDILVKKSRKQDIKYTVRIYCDFTTIDLIKKYTQHDNVELYFYYFPQFFDEKTKMHHLYFGTFIRYLPLFNIKEHNDNYKSVTIVDIDSKFKFEFKLMKYYNNRILFKHIIPNLFYKSNSCYYLDQRIVYLNLQPPFFPIISSFIIQKNPQSFYIFKKFINQLLLNNFNNFNKSLSSYLNHKIIDENKFKGRLEYGVDEYFINKMFLQEYYFNKNRSICIVRPYEKDNLIIKKILAYLSIPSIHIKNTKLVEQFAKVIVALHFPPNYKIQPYNSISQLFTNILDDYFELELHKKKYPPKNNKKIQEIITKITPSKLSLPDNISFCLSNNINSDSKNIKINIIKPNPDYPKFTQQQMDIIR